MDDFIPTTEREREYFRQGHIRGALLVAQKNNFSETQLSELRQQIDDNLSKALRDWRKSETFLKSFKKYK